MKPRRWWHRFRWSTRLHLWAARQRDRWTLIKLRFVAPDPDDAVERQLVGWGVRAELLEQGRAEVLERRRQMRLITDLEDCA